MDPDKKGAEVWQYRAGRAAAARRHGVRVSLSMREQVYFPVADINSPSPGGLHAVELATGDARLVRAAAAAGVRDTSRACNGAQAAAITAIPGVVFSPSNDGAIRAYLDKGRRGRVGVRHEPRVRDRERCPAPADR